MWIPEPIAGNRTQRMLQKTKLFVTIPRMARTSPSQLAENGRDDQVAVNEHGDGINKNDQDNLIEQKDQVDKNETSE